MGLDRRDVPVGQPQELRRGGSVAPRLGVRGEAPKRGGEEPGEPHALSPSLDPDPVHPVVPVAGSDEWQAVRPRGAGPPEGADTVLVQAGAFPGDLGQIVDLVLLRPEGAHPEERHLLVEH
jgi:hypothetical protein